MKKTVLSLAGAVFLLSGIAAGAAEEAGGTAASPAAPEHGQMNPCASGHERMNPCVSGHAVSSRMHKKFMRLDKNKDGFVDKTEAKRNKALSGAFDQIAPDGKLDEAGFAAWLKSQKKK